MVLLSGGIDDLCLKYFVEAGAMGVRRCKKADLKRIARATGGRFLDNTCKLEISFRGIQGFHYKPVTSDIQMYPRLLPNGRLGCLICERG